MALASEHQLLPLSGSLLRDGPPMGATGKPTAAALAAAGEGRSGWLALAISGRQGRPCVTWTAVSAAAFA